MKRLLSPEELEAKAILELPDRALLFTTVVITNLLTGGTVTLNEVEVDVALRMCAGVNNAPHMRCELFGS